MAVRSDPTSSKPTLAGFEADMQKIMNVVLDPRVKKLTVIDIVGSRGVGKTYLAKEIYTSAEVQTHFEVRVWLVAEYVKIGMFEHMKLQLPSLSIEHNDSASDYLRGKRYYVVIDALYGYNHSDQAEALSILRELPDNNNGSRVLVTGRPEYRGRWDYPNFMPILQYKVGPRSNEESLEMLLQVQAASPKDPWDGCPAGEVHDLAMKFVRKCDGLPWPLLFLGGLLSQLPWNEVLDKIEEFEAGGKSFVQFAMSYRDLPDYHYEHRAAFLYFLTFPEGAEIHAKSLFRKLEAERINQSQEDIFECLAERSMIEVTKRYSDNSIKRCRLHDPLFRLLAIHEAKEKRFVRADNSYIVDLFNAKIYFSSIMVKKNHKFGGKFMNVAQLANASCIFNFGENLPLETVLVSNRVLEIDDSKVKVEVLREVKNRGDQLKYLSLNNSWLLSDILEIKGSWPQLTTLVVRDTNIETLPSNELLKMRSLEHLSLRNTKVCEIPKLPASLKTLEVRGTPIEILPELIGNSKLKSLLLRNTRISEIPKLPEYLHTLDVGGTSIESLPYASFCPCLRTLVLKNTKVREIPEYLSFPLLEHLDVRNTFVRSLPDSLWINLRCVLATNTLQHLAGPPSSLEENNRRPNPHYGDLEILETVHVTKTWAKSVPGFGAFRMKKLGLSYFQNDLTAENALDWKIITRILERLKNLYSLKIQGSNVPAEIIDVRTCPSYEDTLKNLSVGGSYSLFSLRGIKLPPHLITLRLDNLEFDEDPMSILGGLKKLESLQLKWLLYTAQIKRMMCSNGSFPQLKMLQLTQIIGLEELSVQEGALPKIRDVVVESCIDLKDLSVPFSTLADAPKGITPACFANWTYKKVL